MALASPLSVWIRNNPNHRLKFWALLGFLPFVIDYFHLYMALDSTPDWGGYVKGAELSALDLLAFCLYLSLPQKRNPLPFRYAMAAYAVAAGLSAIQALQPMEVIFYLWQLARMCLVYATVSRGCEDQRTVWALMRGMTAAVILELVFVVWQRFGLGHTQPSGTIVHQNLLGVMLHPIILTFFALMLSGRQWIWPALTVGAGVFIDISTASRGTVGLAAIGFLMVFLLSGIRKWTPRKAVILVLGAAALVALVPVVQMAFEGRFDAVPLDESYDERSAYLNAAEMMIADHPFGVGANHFAVIGNIGHYYENSGVGAYASGRAGNVHNIYYLVAAESGYLGIATLLILLGAPLLVVFRCILRYRGDVRGELLLGLGCGLLIMYAHSWVEWILAAFSGQYMLAITFGLIAALATQLGYWERRPSQRRREVTG
jgi:O-antigen ligase